MNFPKSFLKRIEVLASRKPRLKLMLKPFYENPGSNRLDQPEYWDALLTKTIKNLKRDDRIVWFLKKARGTRPAFQGKEPQDSLKSSDIDQLLTDITHYIGNAEVNNYQPVLKYIFKDQQSDKLLENLKSLTEKSESLQKEKARLVEQGADKTFLKFEDGWQWHLLDRAGCEREGAAMRHCGNVPSAKKGQRILSLREPIVTKKGKKLWKPHATFIWNSDGSLGEMKGFSNQNPKEDLHPYIVKLLEDDKITKLKGGGYAAKNNFRISDLDESLKDKLIEKRPDLAPSGIDLEDFAQRIDEYIKNEEEYYSSEESLGDYEYILNEEFDNLDERRIFRMVDIDVEDQVKYVLDYLGKDSLIKCCKVETFEGYYTPDNALASFRQGEIERELSEEFSEEWESLSEEQQDQVNRHLSRGSVRRGYIYFEVDAGIALVLDKDSLDEAVKYHLKDKLESELEDKIKDKIEQDNITELLEPEQDGNGWVIKYEYKVDEEEEERVLFWIDIDDEDFINEAKAKIEEILPKYRDEEG